MNTLVYGQTVIGENHIINNTECQDSNSFSEEDFQNQQVNVVAIADGHGGSTYFRSKIGSSFAVEIAKTRMNEFIKRNLTNLDKIDKINYKIYGNTAPQEDSKGLDDERYIALRKHVVESDWETLSISKIQIFLHVGYLNAAKFFNQLIDEKIVEPPTNSNSIRGCKILKKEQSLDKLLSTNQRYKKIIDTVAKSYEINQEIMQIDDEEKIKELEAKSSKILGSLTETDLKVLNEVGISKIVADYKLNLAAIDAIYKAREKENKAAENQINLKNKDKLLSEKQDLIDAINRDLDNLKQQILEEWRTKCIKHLEKHPLVYSEFKYYRFNFETESIDDYSHSCFVVYDKDSKRVSFESKKLNESVNDKLLENPIIIYGSTLICFGSYRNHNFIIDIGDSDITITLKNRKKIVPLEKMNGQLFNMTNSLCQINAIDNIQTCYFNREIKGVLLTTDGVDNGMDLNETLNGFLDGIIESVKDEPDDFKSELHKLLTKYSKSSGDDCTAAFLINGVEDEYFDKIRMSEEPRSFKHIDSLNSFGDSENVLKAVSVKDVVKKTTEIHNKYFVKGLDEKDKDSASQKVKKELLNYLINNNLLKFMTSKDIKFTFDKKMNKLVQNKTIKSTNSIVHDINSTGYTCSKITGKASDFSKLLGDISSYLEKISK